MAGFNLPSVGANADTKALANAFMMLVKELKFLLQNLDSDNVTRLDANKTVFDNLEAETIVTNLLYADTILSNTAVTQVLYAKEGRIARLTVDHLLTGDFLSGADTIYFIEAKDQYLKFIEGTRTDTQVHYTNIDGEPLYWDSADHNYITPNVTDFPVMVYVYDLLVKLALDFEYDGLYNVPKIVLGAGVGNEDYPERGKGYIYKTDDGLLIKYVQSDGGILSMKFGDDGYTIDPPLFIFPENKNIEEVTATSETALPGMEITLKENAKVKFTAQMDVTASEAMTLLIKARIDGVEHRHTVKYFADAYKDGICFSGMFDSVAAGTHIIDMSITPSTGTATIDPEEYHLVLTIENATSVINYTQHQKWEDYPETPDVLIEYPYQAIIEADYAYGSLEGIWFRPITVECYYPDKFPTTWPISDFSRALLIASNYQTPNEDLWMIVQIPSGKNVYRKYDYTWNRWELYFTEETTYERWVYNYNTKQWTHNTITNNYIASNDGVAYCPLNIYTDVWQSAIWRAADPIQSELVGKGYDTLEAFYAGYAGADYKLLLLSKDLIWAENVSTNKEFRTGAGNDVEDREYFKLYRLVNGAWVQHEDYPNIYALRVRAADLTGGYVRVVELNTPIYDTFAGIATNTKLYEKTT